MKFSQAGGKPDMRRFPADFPHLFANYNKTWGQMMDAHIKDSKLRAIVSALLGVLRADALEAGQHLLRASDNPLHERRRLLSPRPVAKPSAMRWPDSSRRTTAKFCSARAWRRSSPKTARPMASRLPISRYTKGAWWSRTPMPGI